MLGYILSALLVMAPLPGLPAIPDGAEVRIVSADMRTVYLLWRVTHGELELQSQPLPIPEGTRVRLIIRSGRQLHAYSGRYLDGDIYVEVADGYVSVKQAFSKVYRIQLPSAEPFVQESRQTQEPSNSEQKNGAGGRKQQQRQRGRNGQGQ